MNYLFAPTPPTALAIVDSDQCFPVHRVYCVGRNYADHAREMGADPSREAPFFFTKPADAVLSNGTTAPYPSQTKELHHEVEMVVALAKGGDNIAVSEALDCVYGYAVGLDLTRRDLQAQAKAKSRPWCTAKAFDHSAIVGAITAKEQCGHINEGQIVLSVNDEVRQSGNTNQMIWSVAEIIAELSRFFTLKPGDLIFTGTPSGVGPLVPGDSFKASVETLAILEGRVS